MWGVQSVAQRQEPLHPPLACLLVHVHRTCLSFAPGSRTQSPWSTYACPPPSQPMVRIYQPSFSLVSWFACPGFVLICPGLRIPASRSLLVRVCSPSLFLAPRFVFVGHLASLLGRVHCRLCACVCWSPLPGRARWAFVRDHSAFSWARLGSFGFIYPLVGLFSGSLASYLYL
jgi:hypothetical protein